MASSTLASLASMVGYGITRFILPAPAPCSRLDLPPRLARLRCFTTWKLRRRSRQLLKNENFYCSKEAFTSALGTHLLCLGQKRPHLFIGTNGTLWNLGGKVDEAVRDVLRRERDSSVKCILILHEEAMAKDHNGTDYRTQPQHKSLLG
ncbi:hypothetical protein CK203_107125 [Vitis vinifera]|uniref:Uncharacterized protein n=1 Tax=Vitis vinifera TaxID=29760 RepID=A0A438DGV8_VITVI|nr:hypothetical protein CK203_107125 [Vitis vinifera]